jgi:hypothetical protein
VQFIDGSAFADVKLDSILIEAGNDIFHVEHEFLLDIVHHKLIRNFSVSSDIEIPRSIEILCSSCFYRCQSLSSISFESNSILKRIESKAFSFSSLQSIEIPRSVQFIDGSAFADVKLDSISIEAGNDIFHVEHEFLLDLVHHKGIRHFSVSSHIEIPRTIEILGSSCFSYCKSLSSISFESNSVLKRIESSAFSSSSLQLIVIPRSVEIICSECFSDCKLSSISFESNSSLKRIESSAFSYSSL